MSRRNSLLLVGVVAIAAIGAYWMLVLAPKREEAAAIETQITHKQAALADAQAEVASYEDAKGNFKANYSMVARLGKAVPADDDVRSLLVQVNSAADRSRFDFRTINISTQGAPATGPAAAKPAAGETPPPGASTVGTAGFSTMPFSFNFKGSFFELGKFFNRLDRFVKVRNGNLDVTGRLLLLNSISLSPDTEKGFPNLTADVSAASYLLPATEGLTAGRDRRQPDRRRRHGCARYARRRAALRPRRPRPSLEPPVSILNDTWRFLVQRRLWPVAILLLAAAVAVPDAARRGARAARPPPRSAVKSDKQSRARDRPDRDRGRRRRPCRPPPRAGLPQGPVQAARRRRPRRRKPETISGGRRRRRPGRPTAGGDTGGVLGASPAPTVARRRPRRRSLRALRADRALRPSPAPASSAATSSGSRPCRPPATRC